MHWRRMQQNSRSKTLRRRCRLAATSNRRLSIRQQGARRRLVAVGEFCRRAREGLGSTGVYLLREQHARETEPGGAWTKRP
jgi:hypothetical protein